jgi:diketogulonate reductase-like aldo/keto reductase
VKNLAKKHGKTEAQIILRWAIQVGLSVIPKTAKVERLKENFEISDWELGQDDIKEID